MKELRGKNAILTGATGGLGEYIANTLAAAGVNLYLVAYPGEGLAKLADDLAKKGIRTIYDALDLRQSDNRKQVVTRAMKEFGAVDILVNNAGVEYNSIYHELTESRVTEVLSVNLEAPMILTHLLLPDMVRRQQGHIVNISSLAGKSGPACQEPYAASKAGLIAFTNSLRATYKGTGVSASVICPGFIEVGIYTRLKSKTGISAPPSLGTVLPQPVADSVVRAIKNDLPEVIVNALPVRPLFATIAMFPRLGEWLLHKMGAQAFFHRVAKAQKEAGITDMRR